ncbi:MAG: hydrogenase [Nitrospirae bacterium]|nr:hydrogenase [Nitrospirota bacterium]
MPLSLHPDLGSQLINLCSMLLLLTTFAIVAQRRLSACVDLFALQSLFLAVTAAVVAWFTDSPHIYIAALLTIAIKTVTIPMILKKVIERVNVKREIEFVINIPPSLLICGALVILAFSVTEPIAKLGFLLTRDSLAIALAIVLIGFFMMIARKKAVTQIVGFLMMENGLFLGATASAYGMPLIVELGVFFDVLVAALIIGVYTHRLQDTFDSVDTTKLTGLKE